MKIKYHKKGGGQIEIDVDTHLRRSDAIDVLRKPWTFRIARGCRTHFRNVEQLQWQLPEMCPVSIYIPPAPDNLTDVSIYPAVVNKSYKQGAYQIGYDPVPYDEDMSGFMHCLNSYDRFYLYRKPWRMKSEPHFRYMMASGGYRAAQV